MILPLEACPNDDKKEDQPKEIGNKKSQKSIGVIVLSCLWLARWTANCTHTLILRTFWAGKKFVPRLRGTAFVYQADAVFGWSYSDNPAKNFQYFLLRSFSVPTVWNHLLRTPSGGARIIVFQCFVTRGARIIGFWVFCDLSVPESLFFGCSVIVRCPSVCYLSVCCLRVFCVTVFCVSVCYLSVFYVSVFCLSVSCLGVFVWVSCCLSVLCVSVCVGVWGWGCSPWAEHSLENKNPTFGCGE